MFTVIFSTKNSWKMVEGREMNSLMIKGELQYFFKENVTTHKIQDTFDI